MRKLYVSIIISVVCFVVFLSGCATTNPPFHVFIDSINSKDTASGKNCIILPGLKDVSAEDLQFKEYVTYVERALVSKGYSIVDNMEKANIVVFLGYGIRKVAAI